VCCGRIESAADSQLLLLLSPPAATRPVQAQGAAAADGHHTQDHQLPLQLTFMT
jgi:hypothetical protein